MARYRTVVVPHTNFPVIIDLDNPAHGPMYMYLMLLAVWASVNQKKEQ